MAACPYCSEAIPDLATVCPFCGSILTGEGHPAPAEAPRATAGGPAGAAPPAPGPVVGEGALRFTHSGHRHLLGYGEDFFGIWDRQRPGGPDQRFPRTDEGWAAAWVAFENLEPGNVPVAAAPPPPGGTPTAGVWPPPATGTWREAPPPEAAKPVSPFWWLLPVLFSLVGGLIAWAVTRGRDPRMARMFLIGGGVMFLLNLYLFGTGAVHFGG